MVGTVNRDGKFSSSRGYRKSVFGKSARDAVGSPLGDGKRDETEDSALDAGSDAE